ncbi:Alanine--glyoxylate aminotransferase 2, mitochondrial [Frankliniella fusca]|uniref:Alanine--glyoxylate aminotransferase 2, mitochondrial n=1 Tax=Frankliniella fusca TaxID=407009 RepID=A0AAE1H787_9NEOP|nr:Alanine--glyoxylate aminotransferase 2, mitochondrial [Frankliniella fusca]
MPACSHVPKPYTGKSFDEMSTTRDKHLVPCLKSYYKKPLLITEGHMQWLFDQTGRRYLDLFGGIVTVSVGHCHPKVTAAATAQMNTLWHTTNIYMHPKIHEYAERLADKMPGDLKVKQTVIRQTSAITYTYPRLAEKGVFHVPVQVVYFVNSGSEANDLAMLLARLYTKQFDIISFRNAYHGMSPYVMGITAHSTWRFDVPVAQGVHHAMNPDPYQGLWGGKHCRDSPVQTTRDCACSPDECEASSKYYEQLEEVFKYSLPRGKVAGLFAESIQASRRRGRHGVGGTVQFPKGFLKKAYELVRINGGVCIADEVQTGFGRTGEHFWGFEGHGVRPDIVTMAKGMGNGFPLAAVVTTPAIAEVLGQALHFNTFGGNPVACAVGLSVLDVIQEERTQENCKVVGTYFLQELAKLRDQFACVGDVRGKGLMIGIEMVSDRATKAPMNNKHFTDVWEDCKNMGVLIGRGALNGNVLRIKPPMCINKEDVDYAVAVLRKALQTHTDKAKRQAN